MVKKSSLLALSFLLLAAVPSLAQLPKLQFEPYFGVYYPMTDLIDEAVNIPGEGSVPLTAKQKEGLAVGSRLTLWLPGPLGAEGNVMYAFSDLDGQAGDQDLGEDGAHVLVADARLIFRFGPPLAPISFHVNGGVAYIDHGGDAYTDVQDGDSSIGAVVGTGMRVRLPGLLGIRVDASGYVYSAGLTVENEEIGRVEFDNQLQLDVAVTAGVEFSLGL